MSRIEDQYNAYPYPERDPADEATEPALALALHEHIASTLRAAVIARSRPSLKSLRICARSPGGVSPLTA